MRRTRDKRLKSRDLSIEILPHRLHNVILARVGQKEIGIRKKVPFLRLRLLDEVVGIESLQHACIDTAHFFGCCALRYSYACGLKPEGADRESARDIEDVARLFKKIVSGMHSPFLPGYRHKRTQHEA